MLAFGTAHAHGMRTEAGILHLLAGEDGDHARDGERLAAVDRLDARVRVRRAHDGHVRHAGQHEVVHVLGGAGDEARILAALDGGAEDARAHAAPPFFSAAVAADIFGAAAAMAATMFW